jgi:hypothetical protein
MLYLIKWNVACENRVNCWNAFGNMTPADDLVDTGASINIIGRWHKIGGTGGICIADASNLEELNTWMLNWAPICEISVEPVVDDASARTSLRSKDYFVEKTE